MIDFHDGESESGTGEVNQGFQGILMGEGIFLFVLLDNCRIGQLIETMVRAGLCVEIAPCRYSDPGLGEVAWWYSDNKYVSITCHIS